jgi:hypothetical protein
LGSFCEASGSLRELLGGFGKPLGSFRKLLGSFRKLLGSFWEASGKLGNLQEASGNSGFRNSVRKTPFSCLRERAASLYSKCTRITRALISQHVLSGRVGAAECAHANPGICTP